MSAYKNHNLLSAGICLLLCFSTPSAVVISEELPPSYETKSEENSETYETISKLSEIEEIKAVDIFCRSSHNIPT